jgi:hypothetical protein
MVVAAQVHAVVQVVLLVRVKNYMRFLCKFFLITVYSFHLSVNAQNDLDALRISQSGVGGSNRFRAMGGAFGAIGADVSCLNYNPAGIGIYRKGDANFSFGLKFSNNGTTHYDNTVLTSRANMLFGNFGIAGSWQSKKNELERHSLGFSSSQLQNFTGDYAFIGKNRKSIANDMLSQTKGKTTSQFNSVYEGLGYNAYLLDTTSAAFGPFYSFVDPNKMIDQAKEVTIKGRMNEMAFGYTYAYDDKIYIGASLGIPTLRYTYSSVHTESDGKDSMRVGISSGTTYTTTYSNIPPSAFYPDLLGFKSLAYTETFSTEGTGYNLKIGGLFRANDYFRFGAYVHTPTIFSFTDKYSYDMVVYWDSGKSTDAIYPDKEGIFDYTLTTPFKYGASTAFVYKKLFVFGVDYEGINYSQAQLGSDNPSDFSGVNLVIKNKYKAAHNFRFGGELNIKPVILRAGYAMYGSPFGGVFGDKFTRNIYSFGLGVRTKSPLYYDFTWTQQRSNEDFYVLQASYINKSDLTLRGTVFAFSIGCKF